jgi:hypothetical protein
MNNKVIVEMANEEEEEERLEDLIPSDILPVFTDNGTPTLIKDDLHISKTNNTNLDDRKTVVS